MSLFRSKPSQQIPIRPTATSFWPGSCPGTQAGGALTLDYGGRTDVTFRVCMTWDALDRLRLELTRHGATPGDASILHGVLTYWGAEEYGRLFDAGKAVPAEGLVLALRGGPGSCEPRRLLQACGLLET